MNEIPPLSAPPQPPPGNGMAITALVLGIVGLCFFPLGIAALVLGIIALKKGQSKGMSIAGIVMGGMAILVIPILASMIIPAIGFAKKMAIEAQVASKLTHIHVAEVEFQGEAHLDQDQDGTGEYAVLGELSGEMTVNGKRLDLIPASMVSADKGYRFIVYVPDGKGGALARRAGNDAVAAKDQARSFIAYAWPEPWGKAGRKAFAIGADGTLYATDSRSGPGDLLATDGMMRWDALGGWETIDSKSWTVHQR